jgi:tetratricopeptide (TPR) repeat protein
MNAPAAVAAAALGLLLTACTALPRAPEAERPGDAAAPASTPAPGSASASPSASLLAQSRDERAAGRYDAAAAALERALRITPADATLWLELAELRLLQDDRPQAAALAQKALTLAGDDEAVIRRAHSVMAAAR